LEFVEPLAEIVQPVGVWSRQIRLPKVPKNRTKPAFAARRRRADHMFALAQVSRKSGCHKMLILLPKNGAAHYVARILPTRSATWAESPTQPRSSLLRPMTPTPAGKRL